MKSIPCFSAALLGLLVSVSSVRANNENAFVVEASRSLNVATVYNKTEKAPWYIFLQAFATSMTASMKGKGAVAMPIELTSTPGAWDAGDLLLKNRCDAILVISEHLPSSLKGKKFVSIRSVCPIGTPVRTFHFVMRKGDTTNIPFLTETFEMAMSRPSFQDTIGQASAVVVVASREDR